MVKLKNFVVYKSSAGSGKTYTLVKEYLRLALYDEKKLSSNFKKILALTFTNKAAAEMKQRVIDALWQLAKGEKTTLSHLLCQELTIDREELGRRAGLVLNHILHRYSDFSIGTIDSFTHKIVKTFAFDLKLPANFSVELDIDGFYEKVISQLLNKIGEDEYISKLLKEFVLSKIENNSSWDPEQQILEFSKLLKKENSEQYLQDLKKLNTSELEEFRKQFIDFIAYYKNKLKTDAQQATVLIEKNKLDDDDFIYKGKGPQRFFYKCLNASINKKDTEGSILRAAIGSNKWAGSSGENFNTVNSISAQLGEIASALIEFITTNYSYYSLCVSLLKQMYPLMLLKKIEEISAEQKEEERLVFITEFNQKIFEIINNEPTPFIYERLGERYHHYLLDEFQDTSSLQWQNILPLLDNSLSGGWFNLIVGDGKQSIYRWRNAKVNQFASLPEIENTNQSAAISERASNLKRNFKEEILKTNYRSLKNIVHFNNSFFDHLSANNLQETGKAIYNQQAQLIKNAVSENAGYISIDYGNIEKERLDELQQEKIKNHISQALTTGFDYRDICILSRTNHHGNSIAEFLLKEKIPIVSSDSLLLKNNLEIHTLVLFLNYLFNSRDVISAAGVINYLLQSHQINEVDFHAYLEELSQHKSLLQILHKCGVKLTASDLTTGNLYDACINIVNALGLNKNAYAYIRFFLDEVSEFLLLKNQSVSQFFDWWALRSKKASLIIPDSVNAVKIMTIHASKGLEFPVVIIPYCNWSIYQSNDTWVNIKHDKIKLPVGVITLSQSAIDSGFKTELEKEQEEQVLDNINLLYVAFTRAIERLHIISTISSSSRNKGVNTWIEDYCKINYPLAENFIEVGQKNSRNSQKKQEGLLPFELPPLQFEINPGIIQIKSAYLKNEAEEAKQEGIILHWLLSKINNQGEVEKAVFLGVMEGLFAQTDSNSISRKLKSIVKHPKLSDYFIEGANSKVEAELVTSDGQILRPDRIVFTKEKTVIIDYKTGKKNVAKHSEQLQKYENALIVMGYSPIEKLLLYTDDLEIITVK